MKKAIQLFILLCAGYAASSQGTCSNPYPINLNGTVQNFSTGSSTGLNILCTAIGLTPITWFSFTTNASAQCPLISLIASDGNACEVGFYTSCGSLISSSSMCLYDGNGLWTPSESYTVSPNTTYFLRVKTASACNISVSGQYYTPTNNTCAGAFSISNTPVVDNNSCHKGSTEVTATQLCAFTMENTAFYQFYLIDAGVAVININNIACDNGATNNSNGFQAGFFTGSCGSLTPLNCTSTSGSFFQLSSDILPAGTHVYLAIDGVSGSNCRYSISGINITGVLDAAVFKNFSVWKTKSGNTLRWTGLSEPGRYYQVERSSDGRIFKPIGKIYQQGTGEMIFTYEDAQPLKRSFYRVRQVDAKGLVQLSETLQALRTDLLQARVIENPVAGNTLKLHFNEATSVRYEVVNTMGQTVLRGAGSGEYLSKDVSSLSSGRYIVRLEGESISEALSFMKL